MTRGHPLRSKVATPLNGAKEKVDRPVVDPQDADDDCEELDPSIQASEKERDIQVSDNENKKRNASEAGDEVACPQCRKMFKSSSGLNSHLANKVCDPSTKKPRSSLSSTKDKFESPSNAESFKDADQDDTTHPSFSATKKRKSSSLKKESRKSPVDKENEECEVRRCSPQKKKRKSTTPKKHKHKSQEAGKSEVDRMKEEGPILSCQSCNKTFTSEFGLVYHTKNKVCQAGKKQENPESKKLQDEPYACSVCLKLFSSKRGLDYHLKRRVCRPGAEENKPLPHEVASNPNRETVSTSSPNQHVGNKVANDGREVVSNGRAVKIKQAPKTNRQNSTTNPLIVDINTTDVNTRRNNFDQLKTGSMHITKFGIVKVIADDRLPSVHHESKMPRSSAVQRFIDSKSSFTRKQRAVAETMYTGGRMRRERLQKMYLKSIDPNSHSTSLAQSTDALSIWRMYCHSVTPHQILHEMMSWKDANGDPFADVQADLFNREDIRCPRDFYPDRIVECVLVNDERRRICSNLDDDQNNTPALGAVPNMRLFLARKELVARYDKSDPCYVCSICRKSFSDIINWKYHVNGNLCIVELKSKHEDRIRRIEAREEETLNLEWKSKPFLSSVHAVLKPKEVNVEFGNPCKIKQHKKHKMPSWIVFNEHHSSMYPELFIALKFKRGSQNRNWAGKKKRSEDYVSSHEARLNRKRKAKQLLMNERASLDSLRKIHEFALQQAAKQEAAKSERRKRDNFSKQPPSFSADAPPTLPPPSLPVDAPPALPPPLPLVEMPDFTTNSHVELFPTTFVDTSKKSTQDGVKDTNSNSKEAGKLHSGNDISTSPLPPQSDVVPSVKSVKAGAAKRKAPRKKKELSKIDQTANEHEEKQSSRSSPAPLSSTAEVDSDSILVDSLKELCSQPVTALTTAVVPPENHSNQTSLDIVTCMDGVKVYHKRNKPDPVVIDTQVLVAECDGGRYPTITRFDGDHVTECVLCTRTDANEDDPLIECDFCKNSAHQICMSKKMLNKDPPIIMRELEPHDSLICHDCVAYCLARRTRAESRRVSKWHYELSRVGLTHPDAAYLEEEVGISKSSENTTFNSCKKQDDSPTYAPCPYGGPGGLICCSHCTAAFSRYLSNTAKEMEAQSIAKVGQEVNDILELLVDAKQRLLNATDINHSNEIRRKLLKSNEV